MASIISAGTSSGTAINISGDTSGNLAFTTQAGANTITVPNATGTMLTTGSPQSGSVIQTVSARNTSSTTTASTTFVTTGFSASISPRFSTSKILVLCSGGYLRASGNYNQAFLTIYRNSTNLGDTTSGLMKGDAGVAASQVDVPVAMSYYDAPATTSSTTYTVYLHTDSSTSSFGLDSSPTTLMLMEIAA